ncbi:MAG: hypothetical protein ACRDJO_01685 [Actinomycetota bacterium]
MTDTDLEVQAKKPDPAKDFAEQKRRMDEARRALWARAEAGETEVPDGKGKGKGEDGACLHF